MVDDLQGTLQQATLESHDRLLMVLYGLIQHVGSRWEEEGIDLVKQLFKSGENGMQKPDALKKGPMMEKLVELLEHFGFVKDDGDSLVHDQEHFISTVKSRLELNDGDMKEKHDALELFASLMDEIPFRSSLPPIRVDGIGLNRDFILNRLRGYIRKTEKGTFHKVLLRLLI